MTLCMSKRASSVSLSLSASTCSCKWVRCTVMSLLVRQLEKNCHCGIYNHGVGIHDWELKQSEQTTQRALARVIDSYSLMWVNCPRCGAHQLMGCINYFYVQPSGSSDTWNSLSWDLYWDCQTLADIISGISLKQAKLCLSHTYTQTQGWLKDDYENQ